MNLKIFKLFVFISIICCATCVPHHSRTKVSRRFSKNPFLFSDSQNSSDGSRLYCLGGDNQNSNTLFSVSELNPTNNEWRSLTEMSTPKVHFGASAIGKKIYVSGGFTENEQLNLLEVFDIESNTWSVLAPMPHIRYFLGMTALNGDIYVSGGRDGSNNVISTVLKYSPETNTWKNVMSMNIARDDHELVTLNGAIYAIAGRGANTVERYSPAIDKWSNVASTKYTHFNFGAASHQNKIYVLSNQGFEVFHPDSNIWQELPSLNIGYGLQLVSINDKLLAVGVGLGDNKYKASKTVYEFDTVNNSWIHLPDMDVARIHHRAVVVNF